MAVILQLERFDRAPPAPPSYSAEDLRAAYEDGAAAGRASAAAAGAEQVKAALETVALDIAALQGALQDDGEARARSLAPVIAALIDGLLPALARPRLEAALLAEFVQLSQSASPLRVTVSCGPDLAEFVTACLAEAQIEAVGVVPDGAPGTVTAQLLGGVITWDEAVMAERLRRLVQEIVQEY